MNNTNFGKEFKRAFPQSSKGQIRRAGRKISTYRGLGGLAVIENSAVAAQAIERCPQWNYQIP
jgi:hypothetical protein